MAIGKGDGVKIKVGTAILAAGIVDKDITFEGGLVAITDSESNGWETYAPFRSTRGIKVGFKGVGQADVITGYFLNTNPIITGGSLVYPNGETFAGDIAISSYKHSANLGKAIEFTCEISFSGPVTHTAGT